MVLHFVIQTSVTSGGPEILLYKTCNMSQTPDFLNNMYYKSSSKTAIDPINVSKQTHATAICVVCELGLTR